MASIMENHLLFTGMLFIFLLRFHLSVELSNNLLSDAKKICISSQFTWNETCSRSDNLCLSESLDLINLRTKIKISYLFQFFLHNIHIIRAKYTEIGHTPSSLEKVIISDWLLRFPHATEVHLESWNPTRRGQHEKLAARWATPLKMCARIPGIEEFGLL